MKDIAHTELVEHIDENRTTLICCVSFEDRCLKLPFALIDSSISKVIVFYNSDVPKGSENLRQIKDAFGSRCVVMPISVSSAIETADIFLDALVGQIEAADGSKMVVDFSTFTHEHLLIFIQCLNFSNVDLNAILWIYCRVEEYSISQTGTDKWLSSGVFDIRTVLGYSGSASAGLPTFLVALVGFEGSRAVEVIESVEPAKLFLGKGASGQSETTEMAIINKKFHDLVSREQKLFPPSDVVQFDFSCNDIEAVASKISSLVNEFSETGNLVVLPMNTKVSTLGVALAFLRGNNFSVLYGQAMAYNSDGYSKASDRCYLMSGIFQGVRQHT
jgi:hypothetical protein